MKYYLSINLYFVVLVLIPAGIQSFSEWKTNVKLHSINYCGTIAGRGSQTEKGEKCYKTESSHRFCCLNRKFLRVRHMPSLLIWSPSCPLNSILAPIKRSLWLMLGWTTRKGGSSFDSFIPLFLHPWETPLLSPLSLTCPTRFQDGWPTSSRSTISKREKWCRRTRLWIG